MAKYVLFPGGRRQITDLLLPGELNIFEALIDIPRPTTLLALSDVEICTFDREELCKGIAGDPQRTLGLMQSLATRFQNLRDLLTSLGSQSAQDRLASLLLRLLKRLGATKLATTEGVEFPLRQQDLADILGLTQSHIARTLKLMRETGILTIEQDRLRVLDLQMLTRLAER